MALDSLKFVVTTSYGMLSMVAYVVVCSAILRNYKQFKGSFFVLFLVSAFINVITYFNSFITLRLPQNTCKTCILAPYFEKGHYTGLEIFQTIHYHCAYLQYLMIMTISFNRCTMIFAPFGYDRKWLKAMPLVVAAIFLLPFIATLRLFLGYSQYTYVPSFDGYATNTSVDRETIYNFLLPFFAIVTVLSALINIASVIKLHQVNPPKKPEVKLF